MPAYWSKKDERQYQHIKSSCMIAREETGRTARDCKRIAAATVNIQRRREGRTLTLSQGPVERVMRERRDLGRRCATYMRQENKVCLNPIGIGLGALAASAVGVVIGGALRRGA